MLRNFLKLVPLALATGLLGASATAEEDRPVPSFTMVVIVSDQVALKDISTPDLRRVFTQGKVTFAGNIDLIPINAAAHSPLRTLFDRQLLGLEPEAVGRYWIDQKIRGTALPPKSVSSEALAAKIVAKVKGTITYVGPNQVPPGAHALTIDGKGPGQTGYLLAAQPAPGP